jgi:uncharacterized membrane protein HdeD (DUF308 family)
MRAVGVLLLILGILALGYQGFTYVTRDKVVDLGPVEVTQEKTKTVYLPPILGVVALAAGIALLVSGSRNT